MTFDLSWYSVPKEEEDKEEETVVYGIPGNPELERIIPGKFHSFVNEIIMIINTAGRRILEEIQFERNLV